MNSRTTPSPPPSPMVKSAGRVFEVFELFRAKRKPLSVRDISEYLSYPMSSTSVLLKSLGTLGYLAYDRRRRTWFPTLRLSLLGDWVPEMMFVGGSLTKVLEQVMNDTEETAVLGLQNDIYAQYVHMVPSRQPIQFNTPPGTRRLLCASGMGWALLSTQSDGDILRACERTNHLFGDSIVSINSDKTLNEINKVRQSGYAFSKYAVTSATGMIAMPIPLGDTPVQLAIGVGGVAEQLEDKRDLIVAALGRAIGAMGS